MRAVLPNFHHPCSRCRYLGGLDRELHWRWGMPSIWLVRCIDFYIHQAQKSLRYVARYSDLPSDLIEVEASVLDLGVGLPENRELTIQETARGCLAVLRALDRAQEAGEGSIRDGFAVLGVPGSMPSFLCSPTLYSHEQQVLVSVIQRGASDPTMRTIGVLSARVARDWTMRELRRESDEGGYVTRWNRP